VTLLLGMRSRSSVVGVGVVLAGLSAGWAQQGTRAVATPLPVVTGSVTGRVICSDTNGPARFANVILQPVVGPKPVLTEKQGGGTEQHETMKIVQTGLDGSFSISKVRPGVIAEKAGYRSPLEISREEMDHPSEQVAKKMAALLTPVSVAANRGSTAEVRLLRGASVSGVVRFDDGSPDGSADVKLWSKNKKGEWAQYKGGLLGSAGGSTTTGDAGQFRLSGLPAGEYLLSVGLEVTTVMVDRVGDRTDGWYSNSLYTLNVFAPGATRKRTRRC